MGAERIASVIWVGRSPDHRTPTEMAVVDAFERTPSNGKRDSANRLVNGVSLQSAWCSTQTLSKRTLSVRTKRRLRAFGALGAEFERRGARRTGECPSAPVPNDASTVKAMAVSTASIATGPRLRIAPFTEKLRMVSWLSAILWQILGKALAEARNVSFGFLFVFVPARRRLTDYPPPPPGRNFGPSTYRSLRFPSWSSTWTAAPREARTAKRPCSI